MSNFFKQLQKHSQKIALKDSKQSITYQELLNQSTHLQNLINSKIQKIGHKTIFLTDRNIDYPITQFGIWASQGTSIPICPSSSFNEIEYYTKDSQPDLIITTEDYLPKMQPLIQTYKIPYIVLDKNIEVKQSKQQIQINQNDAIILYTSGTTGFPKGVVHTHNSIQAQIESLTNAWQWTDQDHIIQFLPLNHIHGVQNILNSSLYNGAFCEMVEQYDTRKIWEILLRNTKQPNIFMAVPSVFYSLSNYYDKKLDHELVKKQLLKLRLIVSGSSALPEKEMIRWKQISGQEILERFGMTEIGMGLSNDYFAAKLPGKVGKNLPGVQSALLEDGEIITENGLSGELLIKSKGMFDRYLNKEKQTIDAFYQGWFKTGDYAIRDDQGCYKILGRISIDIIKKSGWKISAFEIEDAIRKNQFVEDCAVVGVDSDKYGQEICAYIILKTECEIQEIKNYCKQSLSQYKVPQLWRIVSEIPRNSMGKVNKQLIMKWFSENQ